MNYIQRLGALAIASRLRGLTDLLVRDMTKIYREQNIKFEPRWFAFLHLLNSTNKLSITEIATELNQSHPAVNQVANSLEKEGIILSIKDKNDKRRRIIILSNKGKKLVKKSIYIWEAVNLAATELIEESFPELLDGVLALEQSLTSESIYNRINKQIKQTQLRDIQIIDYDPRYKNEFRDLNVEWLEEYFEIEPEDERILSNPESEILSKGGRILFARKGDHIIGTAALIKIDQKNCERTKMAVGKEFQRKQAGRKLLNTILEIAKKDNYERVILFTSPKLINAVKLYQSIGFKEPTDKSVLNTKLKRCSIQLELKLNV